MKLVIQVPGGTTVKDLEEHQLVGAIREVRKEYKGTVIPPRANEVFRYKLARGVVVVYRDNRQVRTRNFWFEVRALASLSRELGTSFRHSVKFNPRGLGEVEVDGVGAEDDRVMVEVKRRHVTQDIVDYYEKKRKGLKFKECVLVAPKFAPSLRFPKRVTPYTFKADFMTLMRYYNEDFGLPKWFEPRLPDRHVRVLLQNGRWHGVRRKLTRTAKHTPTSKLVQDVDKMGRHRLFPVRVYYTLSAMASPVDEFRGKGRPLPRVLAAIDVDSDHGEHVIGPSGHCELCLREARAKADLVGEKLTADGLDFETTHSGFKGYHFYLKDEEGLAKEVAPGELLELAESLVDDGGRPLTDTVHFRARDGSFDVHRVFKLPGSVDAATGVVSTGHLQELQFDDVLLPL
ncbi:MAG: hypothetical protein ACTSU5_02750 [Promethearchaeota archaeon]